MGRVVLSLGQISERGGEKLENQVKVSRLLSECISFSGKFYWWALILCIFVCVFDLELIVLLQGFERLVIIQVRDKFCFFDFFFQ